MNVLLRLCWPLIILTLFHLSFITVFILPEITSEVGGLRPLDILFSGYTFGQASTFLATLQESDGTAYAQFHNSHDMIFPALYGISLALAIWALDFGLSKNIRVLLSSVPLAAAILDYFENAVIVELINTDIEMITPEMIERASGLTETKFLLIGLSVGILFVILMRNYVKNAPPKRKMDIKT